MAMQYPPERLILALQHALATEPGSVISFSGSRKKFRAEFNHVRDALASAACSNVASFDTLLPEIHSQLAKSKSIDLHTISIDALQAGIISFIRSKKKDQLPLRARPNDTCPVEASSNNPPVTLAAIAHAIALNGKFKQWVITQLERKPIQMDPEPKRSRTDEPPPTRPSTQEPTFWTDWRGVQQWLEDQAAVLAENADIYVTTEDEKKRMQDDLIVMAAISRKITNKTDLSASLLISEALSPLLLKHKAPRRFLHPGAVLLFLRKLNNKYPALEQQNRNAGDNVKVDKTKAKQRNINQDKIVWRILAYEEPAGGDIPLGRGNFRRAILQAVRQSRNVSLYMWNTPLSKDVWKKCYNDAITVWLKILKFGRLNRNQWTKIEDDNIIADKFYTEICTNSTLRQYPETLSYAAYTYLNYFKGKSKTSSHATATDIDKELYGAVTSMHVCHVADFMAPLKYNGALTLGPYIEKNADRGEGCAKLEVYRNQTNAAIEKYNDESEPPKIDPTGMPTLLRDWENINWNLIWKNRQPVTLSPEAFPTISGLSDEYGQLRNTLIAKIESLQTNPDPNWLPCNSWWLDTVELRPIGERNGEYGVFAKKDIVGRTIIPFGIVRDGKPQNEHAFTWSHTEGNNKFVHCDKLKRVHSVNLLWTSPECSPP